MHTLRLTWICLLAVGLLLPLRAQEAPYSPPPAVETETGMAPQELPPAEPLETPQPVETPELDEATGTVKWERPGQIAEDQGLVEDLLALPGAPEIAPGPPREVENLQPDDVPVPQEAGLPLSLIIQDKGEAPRDGLVLAVPGEKLDIQIALPEDQAAEEQSRPTGETAVRAVMTAQKETSVAASAGAVEFLSPTELQWSVPEAPGLHTLDVEVLERYTVKRDMLAGATEADARKGTGRLAVMVQYPYNRQEDLIGTYSIGVYPNEDGHNVPSIVARLRENYSPPEWFILVNEDTSDYKLSKRFRVSDFASPSEYGRSHYIAIQPELIAFLEALWDAAELRFGKTARVKILRAYLAPSERLRLERRNVRYTEFSRYQYGDAAAIIVDTEGNDKLGDLNGDGRLDREDANVLADLVAEVKKEMGLRGAVGVVDQPVEPNWPETPYVVVDLRGENTRW